MVKDWKTLSAIEQLEEIKSTSFEKPVVIFKHSTRCSISSVAMDRLERQWNLDDIDFYYLDLIQFRDVSNAVASEFGVYHQSPQILVIRNGNSVYDNSHMGVNYNELVTQLEIATA